MDTVLYLIRHGATAANLAKPALLQGRKHNPPLAPLGIRQAQATRDFLAIRPMDACYCSPLQRAVQTAAIVAESHNLVPIAIPDLTECDVGRWEGLDWHTIRQQDPSEYELHMSSPGKHGYPDGESFAEVYDRVAPVIDDLLLTHEGQSLLIVAHNAVNRTYLAGLLGLGADQARQVVLDNCGISVVIRKGSRTTVATLNAAFHLQGVAA